MYNASPASAPSAKPATVLAAEARIDEIERAYPNGDAPKTLLAEHAQLSDEIVVPYYARLALAQSNAAAAARVTRDLTTAQIEQALKCAAAALRSRK